MAESGYFVKNGQIMEASAFFLLLLGRLLNPALTIVLSDFSNIDTTRDGVSYVENGWFELWVMGRERGPFVQCADI